MQKVKPTPPRIKISEPVSSTMGRAALQITMPAPRRWHLAAFYGLCLSLSLPVGFIVLLRFSIGNIADRPDIPILFLIIWAIGWFLSSLFALLSLLWITFGEEIVKVTAEELILERRIFGLHWTRSFNQGDLTNLRVASMPLPPWWQQGNGEQYINPFQNRGNLAFDYGAKTYRFGSGIDEAEAFTVRDRLNMVLERYQ